MKARCRTAALFTLALACALPALGQTIRVQCSDSLAGLGQKWAWPTPPGIRTSKSRSKVGAVAAAFAALRDQKASLAIVSRMMRYSETEALQTALGQRPAEFKVGVNAVAVYVNAGNPAQVLTYDELAGIFQGKCRNWNQIGGPVAPIALYSPQTNSAVGELFAEEILNGKEYAAGLRTLAGADLLKAIANDKNGIGYGPLISDPRVRALGIKRALSSTPVEPTEETIANRIYPISRYLYVYLNPAAHQGGLKAWVDWMRSDEGQQIVKAAGFFPLPAKLRSGIQFDRASGFCSSAFDLGLSAPFPDAAIYYTTNGASPGPVAGFRYHRPIPIAGTAIVRAAAFGGETVLTEAAARTYLFIPDLLRQTGRGFPDSWGASEGKPVPAHYGMSSSLADSPASRAAIIEGLRSCLLFPSLPTPGISSLLKRASMRTRPRGAPLGNALSRPSCCVPRAAPDSASSAGCEFTEGRAAVPRNRPSTPSAWSSGRATVRPNCIFRFLGRRVPASLTAWFCGPGTTIPGCTPTGSRAAGRATSGTNGCAQALGPWAIPAPAAASCSSSEWPLLGPLQSLPAAWRRLAAAPPKRAAAGVRCQKSRQGPGRRLCRVGPDDGPGQRGPG